MKNETKHNVSLSEQQKLPTRNTRPQEESESINAYAWGRPSLTAPYVDPKWNPQIWRDCFGQELEQ